MNIRRSEGRSRGHRIELSLAFVAFANEMPLVVAEGTLQKDTASICRSTSSLRLVWSGSVLKSASRAIATRALA